MSKFFKELIFFLFFLILIVLTIGILFYEFIPNQIIPEVTKYEQSSGTETLLTQIREETEEKDNKSDILKTYKVSSESSNKEDETTNTEIEQGKNYPFYDYTKAVEENNNTESEEKSEESKKLDENITNKSENSNVTLESTSKDKTAEKNDVSSENTNNVVDNTITNDLSNTSSTEKKINTSNLRDVSNPNKTTK